jgi:hypothetical protein
MAEDLLSPDDLVGLFDDEQFKALPFDQRKQAGEQALMEASQWMAREGQWTPDTFRDFGKAAQGFREEVDASKTWGESVGGAFSVVGKTLADTASMLGITALDAATVTDPSSSLEDLRFKAPLGSVGPALVRGTRKLVDSADVTAAQIMSGEDNAVVDRLAQMRTEIDEGKIPLDREGLNQWMQGHSDDVAERQGYWYHARRPETAPTPEETREVGWADKRAAKRAQESVSESTARAAYGNSIMADPVNARLLAGYLQTRNPEVWAKLEGRLLTDPQTMALRAENEKALERDGMANFLKSNFGPEAGALVDEAGDPMEWVGAVFAPMKGAQMIQRGRKLASRAGDVAMGVGAEVLSEQGSLQADDPFATLEQRMEVARDTVYGALGLMGVGAGVSRTVDALTGKGKAPAVGDVANAPGPAPTVEGNLPGTPVTPVPESERSPGMTGLEEDTGDLTLDDVADLEGTAADARFMPPPNLTSGLTDLGTVEGDLLTDARFRPPAQPVRPPLPSLPNVTDQSGLTDLGTVEGNVLERVPQPPPAATNLADIQRGDRFTDQEGNTWEVWKSRQGTVEAHPVINGKPVVNNQTTERWATTPEARTRNPSDRTDMTPAGGTVITDPVVNESLTAQDETQTAQADAVIAQESQARGIRPPTPGTVSRQGSALPFEEIVAMAAAAIRNGVTNFSAWATAMVRRFGEGVRRYLAEAWQSAKKNSQVGALDIGGNVTRMASDLGAAQNTEPSTGGLEESYAKYLEARKAGNRRLAQHIVNEVAGVQYVNSSIDRQGAHSPSGPDDGSPLWDIAANGVYPEDVYGPNGLRYYSTGEDRQDREAFQQIQSAKGSPNKKITIYRALEKSGPTQIKPGEWVTTVKAYAKDHGENALNGDYKIISKTVSAKDIFTSGDSWLEWGYHPQPAFPDAVIKGTDPQPLPFERFAKLSESARAEAGAGFTNTQVVATRPDGSTVIFSELVDIAGQGIRAGLTLAQWTTAMVRRFGEGVRQMLASAWQAATAAANRAAKAPVTFGQRPLDRRARAGEGGFTGGSPLGQDGPPNLAETRSRFARPDAPERLYEVRPDADVRQQAETWLGSMSMEQAVAAMEAGRLPASMTMDVAQQAAGLILQRTTEALRTGTEVQQMQARTLGHRMSRVWQGWLSQEASRSLRQRAVVKAELVPYAPILAAEGLLIDRGDAVVGKRFEGGGAGVVAKITSILSDAQSDISERVERILQAVMGARMSPRVTLRDAVANLVNGRTQRDQMIDDVAKALLQRARTRQVKPEQQTALAALVASLKRTLGAAVKGEAVKPDALPFGELLARTFVDQVAEAPLFEEAWKAGREQVRGMLIDLGMSEADAVTRLNELMPATPTVAYAPGMVKQAVQRGFEAAGYGQTLETQMDRAGKREVDVRAEALRDPRKAQDAVMRIWDEQALAAGISPEAWMQGRKLASKALAETMQQWQEQAAKAKEKAAQAQRDRLLANDSPSLGKLLKELVAKIAPGMTWSDIFMELPSTQRERQRAIYQRLMLDERLRGLSADERLKLTNELDKAWQRERRKVFNRELQRAGVLGEKGIADRVKIQKAMPKLLRLINLGMMNSEMFREAIAPQYGLRMISSADAVGLRKLAEQAWALPEGVLRNRKLAEMLDSIQRTTGGSVAEILNSYWVAAVLSGLRTMFDTFMAVTTGFGTSLTQQGMLLARGKGRAAWQAHGQWWRGLGQGLDESFGILWNGDYRFQKRFNEDLRRAMDGESTFRPVPLGEALWRQGGLWKFPAAVMLWTGRLMAAADHINNTATTHGAMAVARALNPELYAGKAGFTPQERAAAEAQALNEVTGGTSPANADERRTVKARTREILHGLLKPETRTEANFIGDESAYQNDPIGFLGLIYQMLNSGLGFGERFTLAAAQRINGQGPGAGFARGAMAFAAGALRSATGTKFARFGANFGNHIWSFVPGSYLMSRGGQALGNIERTRSQNDLLLGRNVIGLALGVSTFALLGDKDDEDDGMHIEGSWSGLTLEEKAQRRSAGFEPLTLWWRDGDKIKRQSYKSWPTAGIFAGVGAYADERRFQPARAASRGWAGHLLHAAGAGVLQIKDVNAMRGLAELFGASASSSDPEADAGRRLIRMSVGFAGAFVPTAVKDLDALRDPRSYRAEGVMEELARSVPGLRQTVNGGRPSINLLGDPILYDRKPWSRAFTSTDSPEPYRVLGVLLSRGLSLPAASPERYVWHDGTKVQIKSLGRDAEYKYAKAVGKGYKEWLSTEGQDLLTQPPEAIARQIRSQSERIKMMAALQAFGGN